MENDQPKLSYSAARKRVRLEFSISYCLAHETPPTDLLDRAKAKMEEEKSKNAIDFYFVYDQMLASVWASIRAIQPENEVVGFDIAAGGKIFKGVDITKSEQEGIAYSLTLVAPPSDTNAWEYEDFELCIDHLCLSSGINKGGHPAQLEGAFFRARVGTTCQSLAISSVDTLKFSDRPYKLVANKARREVILIICDPLSLRSTDLAKEILTASAEGLRKLKESSGVAYEFRRESLVRKLQKAMKGPQKWGIGMPVVCLVGQGPAGSDEAATPAEPKKASYPGAGLLKIRVTEDKMSGVVDRFDQVTAKKMSFQATRNWLLAELRRQNIKYGVTEPTIEKTLQAIAAGESIDGWEIAIGQTGTAAQKPYLYESYRDIKSVASSSGAVDLRESTTKMFVNPGELVAELKYHIPKVTGKTVFGETMEPGDSETAEITVSDGIEEREPGKYYALVAGIPQVEAALVGVSPRYVHKGDVNLKTGNIRFEGSVVIEGSIDNGATVETAGDLEVTGSVGFAFIRVGGDMNVQGGIVTTEKGRVYARQNIKASFIENSRLCCGGNLNVNKSILNSEAIVGGNIEVNVKDGLLAGGSYSCSLDMKAGRLGFPQGNMTVCNVGVDWKLERSLKIRETRYARFSKVASDDRMALRELVRKKKTQMTAKHQQMIDLLQIKIQRVKVVLTKLEKRLEESKEHRMWNKDSTIKVYGLLASNVDITVGEIKIPVKTDVAGVVLATVRRKGSFISALEEGNSEEESKAS
ncbi:MAG: DUF342 domain-containing protein [Oligoflexales bacterium]